MAEECSGDLGVASREISVNRKFFAGLCGHGPRNAEAMLDGLDDQQLVEGAGAKLYSVAEHVNI
jgi:hypothetical protein